MVLRRVLFLLAVSFVFLGLPLLAKNFLTNIFMSGNQIWHLVQILVVVGLIYLVVRRGLPFLNWLVVFAGPNKAYSVLLITIVLIGLLMVVGILNDASGLTQT